MLVSGGSLRGGGVWSSGMMGKEKDVYECNLEK